MFGILTIGQLAAKLKLNATTSNEYQLNKYAVKRIRRIRETGAIFAHNDDDYDDDKNDNNGIE